MAVRQTKMLRQPNQWAIRPPSTGAEAGATPLMAPVRAMMRARARPLLTSAGMVRARK